MQCPGCKRETAATDYCEWCFNPVMTAQPVMGHSVIGLDMAAVHSMSLNAPATAPQWQPVGAGPPTGGGHDELPPANWQAPAAAAVAAAPSNVRYTLSGEMIVEDAPPPMPPLFSGRSSAPNRSREPHPAGRLFRTARSAGWRCTRRNPPTLRGGDDRYPRLWRSLGKAARLSASNGCGIALDHRICPEHVHVGCVRRVLPRGDRHWLKPGYRHVRRCLPGCCCGSLGVLLPWAVRRAHRLRGSRRGSGNGTARCWRYSSAT